MDKIAFIGNSEPPNKLLQIWKKQTPGSKGVWGNLQGVDNYEEADYFGVIDYLPSYLKGKIKEDKCVFLGAHPETMSAYRDMSNYICLAKYDCANTFGFGEWWINYDYDYLKALEKPKKTKILGAIVSNARSQSYHTARIEWLKRFCDRINIDFDLYGRIEPDTDSMKKYYRGACGSQDARGSAVSGGNDHMSGKESIYEQHLFMIEFDATGRHYFSERVFDCMLLWAIPIYWGGSGLHEYIPKESFHYLDINGNGSDVLEIIEKYNPITNYYLTETRNILLDELQLWPRIHKAIYGTFNN